MHGRVQVVFLMKHEQTRREILRNRCNSSSISCAPLLVIARDTRLIHLVTLPNLLVRHIILGIGGSVVTVAAVVSPTLWATGDTAQIFCNDCLATLLSISYLCSANRSQRGGDGDDDDAGFHRDFVSWIICGGCSWCLCSGHNDTAARDST